MVPRSATSLLDSIVLLCKSTKLLDSLRGTGHCQSETVEKCMASSYQATLVHQPQHPLFPTYVVEPSTPTSGSSHVSAQTEPCGDVLEDDRSKWYDPWPLKPWSRAAGLFFPAALLTTLLVLLDHSSKSNGLAHYPDDDSASRHYLWTSLPTLIFTLLSLFLGSFDSEIRSLSSFAALYRASAGANFDALRVSYTDELGIRTILRALRHRDGVVAASKAVAIVAVFLTNFGASIFREEPAEHSVARKVQQETWITTGECSSSAGNWYSPYLAGELVVNANLSFPPGTYEDMLLPDFTLLEEPYDERNEGDSRWSSLADANSVVRVTIPAVRPKLDCSLTTVANNRSGNQIGIELFGMSLICTSQCDSGNRAFGMVVLSSCHEAMDSGNWQERLPVTSLSTNYIWGACPDNNNTRSIPSAKLLSCHESLEEVDVGTTWLGSGLDGLDHANPPQPNDASARPYETPDWIDTSTGISCGLDMYNELGDMKSETMDFSLDAFFRTLTQSHHDFAIPEAYLAATGADRDEEVASAIKRLHGILRVQSVQNAAYSRLHYNQQSTSPPFRRTRPGPVIAEVTYPGRRLVQSKATTYAIVGLLGVMLALNIVTIALSSEWAGGGGRPKYRRVVPQSPGTIAALASLLADSNVFRYLPEHSQWLGEEKIAQVLRGQKFSMGWLDVDQADPQSQDREQSRGRKRFTIRLSEGKEEPGRTSRGDSESSG